MVSLYARASALLLGILSGTNCMYATGVTQPPENVSGLSAARFSPGAPMPSDSIFRKVKIYVFAGTLIQFPAGKGVNNFSQQLKQSDGAAGPGYTVEGSTKPIATPLLGVKAGLAITPRISAGLGLQFYQSGHRLLSDFSYRDPEYQYDEVLRAEQNVRASILAIPAWFSWHWQRSIRFELAVAGGFAVNSTVTTQYRKVVIINGEPDEESSVPVEKQKETLGEQAQSFVPSVQAAVSWAIRPSLEVSATGQYAGNHSRWNGGVANAGIGFLVSYSF